MNCHDVPPTFLYLAFLEGGSVGDFMVPKRISVMRGVNILLTESNVMALDGGNDSLMHDIANHGALMTGQTLDMANVGPMTTAGMLLIRNAVIEKSLKMHGIRRLGT